MSEVAEHFEGGSLDGVVPEDQENTEGQEGSAVSDIAEHDAEEEGESDSGEDGGVELLVAGDAVSVGDFLGDESVAVSIEGGGRFAEFDLMQCGRGDHLAQTFAQKLNLILGHIELAIDNLFPEFELVEGFIDHPFPPQEDPPALKISNIFDLVQKGDHLLLVHGDEINNFIVLFAELLEGLPGVVFHFAEEEKVLAEGLYYPLDFLL